MRDAPPPRDDGLRALLPPADVPRVPPRDDDADDFDDFVFDEDLDDCGGLEDCRERDDFEDFDDSDDFDDFEDDADDLPARPAARTRPSSSCAPDARLSSSRRASAFASSGVR
ncbi:hypothetical protein [Bifidobacterium stellenboschense]|uniref:hypothetical protein n=1 Tax=Bifidobacterium stellenboschense TaxID=762211 RepID=UPI000550A41E|nr:hypothetical protein [Bifidobacterium stellenboschense]